MDNTIQAEDEELDEGDALDLTQIELLLGITPDEDSVFSQYRTHVINDGLLPYKLIIHYSQTEGGKAGESLYNHVLNGIFVLEQLRHLVKLTDDEARVLFTAFTIHDINKVTSERKGYLTLTTVEAVAKEISNVKLDIFFTGYDIYLNDIISLMQRHSAHLWTGAQAFNLRNSRFQLDDDRLDALVDLMRAADGIDLSHTLDEQRHKDQFLIHLNNFSRTQYAFWSHRIAEQRGSFTNIIHNAVVDEMVERFKLTPLLFYPDGVAYLRPKGNKPELDETVVAAVAARVGATINEMTSEGFRDFIRPINMGITVDKKCLDLNLPFRTLFEAIYGIIQRRVIKDDKLQRLANDSIQRTHKNMAKRGASASKTNQTVLAFEASTAELNVTTELEAFIERGVVPVSAEGMRSGELLRTHYIFLIEHFANAVPQAWPHLYQLLDLPTERWVIYDGFDARMDRAYAIATELTLTEAELSQRIIADGTRLLADRAALDPRLPVLTTYLEHVLTFEGQERSPADFAATLPTYVRQQHKQCVQCSLPLPTQKWGSGNVRSDIKVQMFSNRLAGGPGEPVKRVCDVCMIQYLVEKLNYREIRGEQTIYLHLFPYSFMTAPFLSGLRSTLREISRQDVLAGALRIANLHEAMIDIAQSRRAALRFTTRTKAGKAQPFGVYGPKYSQTLGGLITLPLNPGGETTTETFFFALQHALLLHHHFGCKVLVSNAAVPPLDKEAFGDVYFDLTPLSSRGFIRHNDYHSYQPGTSEPGTLQKLWHQLDLLYRIRAVVATAKDDPVVLFIAAMADHPLRVFYVAEKQAEAKAGNHAGILIRQMADDVRQLALSMGDPEMSELDHHLRRLAEIARQGNLRGSSWKKSSMITALDEVLRKIGMQSEELNPAVLQAAATEDMFDHIMRTRSLRGFSGGKNLRAACEAFVETFFSQIYFGVYGGKPARLLNHEKVLRSAYHFYLQDQYRSKPMTKTEAQTEELPETDTDEA